MASSALWRAWVDVAAFLPVLLLEGSALALAYGRHHWFRSEEQRRLASTANWIIWILLAVTSVVHFAVGRSENGTVRGLMAFYASYVLPLAIVAVPMLWKKLYDAGPESAQRIAVLEVESALRSELIQIQKEQNGLIIHAIRDAMDTPAVVQARRQLFEQASIEHARNVVGFIKEGDQKPRPQLRPGFAAPKDEDHPKS